MADSNVDITSGVGTSIDTWTVGTQHRQIVILGDKGGVKGRAGTFRTIGTTAADEKLLAIWNAVGSTIKVDVNKITVDATGTVANTANLGIFRLSRITAIPTGGTAITKGLVETSRGSSSASVTVYQNTASDGGVVTSLACTPGVTMTQEYAPRLLTLVGQEAADRVEFMSGMDEVLVLGAGEGLVLWHVGVGLATNHMIATVQWEEYTP